MDLPEEWTTGTVSANGIDLRYYRAGDGPPIVMAHGFYDNGRCWIPLANVLADEYEVVTYDARGHGRSDAPDGGYDLENRIADLAGLVESLGLEDPVLVGHSMGGATAAWTAARRPDLPTGLVLEDPAPLFGEPDADPDERARIVRERLEDRSNRTIEEEIEAEYDGVDPEWVRRYAVADTECSPAIAEIARAGTPPVEDAFEAIRCPTLVLRSDAEPERRARDLEVADRLRDGRLVHVPGSGHYVFRTEYEAAIAELRTFLRRL